LRRIPPGRFYRKKRQADGGGRKLGRKLGLSGGSEGGVGVLAGKENRELEGASGKDFLFRAEY